MNHTNWTVAVSYQQMQSAKFPSRLFTARLLPGWTLQHVVACVYSRNKPRKRSTTMTDISIEICGSLLVPTRRTLKLVNQAEHQH
ncbi:hypothetical protein BaRGS_00032534 [Batillaria attramentaria]|uniref:Uncharacterized protein n=1 Tax=Batillaria attramentaria TaxID=370345 RepID=A0ABD0JMI0_9CAEN